jgi:hypothetical protein
VEGAARSPQLDVASRDELIRIIRESGRPHAEKMVAEYQKGRIA